MSSTKTSRPINVRTSKGALTTNGTTNLLDPSFSKPAVRAQGGRYRDAAARLHRAGYALRLLDTTQVIYSDWAGNEKAQELTDPSEPGENGWGIFSGGSNPRGVAIGGTLEIAAPDGKHLRMPMQILVGQDAQRPTRNRVLVTDIVGQILRMLDENAYDTLGEDASLEDYLEHVTR